MPFPSLSLKRLRQKYPKISRNSSLNGGLCKLRFDAFLQTAAADFPPLPHFSRTCATLHEMEQRKTNRRKSPPSCRTMMMVAHKDTRSVNTSPKSVSSDSQLWRKLHAHYRLMQATLKPHLIDATEKNDISKAL